MRITLSFFLMTANNVVRAFTNEQLFKKESFPYAQVTFATFHFTATSIALWIASSRNAGCKKDSGDLVEGD
jgi:hypothetical protein